VPFVRGAKFGTFPRWAVLAPCVRLITPLLSLAGALLLASAIATNSCSALSPPSIWRISCSWASRFLNRSRSSWDREWSSHHAAPIAAIAVSHIKSRIVKRNIASPLTDLTKAWCECYAPGCRSCVPRIRSSRQKFVGNPRRHAETCVVYRCFISGALCVPKPVSHLHSDDSR